MITSISQEETFGIRISIFYDIPDIFFRIAEEETTCDFWIMENIQVPGDNVFIMVGQVFITDHIVLQKNR